MPGCPPWRGALPWRVLGQILVGHCSLTLLQAVPTLLFWEVKRKDFWEQMAHHIATIGLIAYSYHVKCGA